MYSYCVFNPVNMVDPTGEEAVAIAIGGIAFAFISAAMVLTQPQVQQGISNSIDSVVNDILSKVSAKSRASEKDVALPPSQLGTTYYHVTTMENAATIVTNGVLNGSKWEGGYVYAWKNKPDKYAINNSGAHKGVILSFKTASSFVPDRGIKDPAVLLYGPVVSAAPGPVIIWDIQIVG